MECPKCNSSMEEVRWGGADRIVNRCTNCGGLFFLPKELSRMRESFTAEYLDHGDPNVGRKFNEVEDIQCPVCGARMDKVSDSNQTHIWYESCPNGHGVYFDAGELSDLNRETLMDKVKGWVTGTR
ncbi:MAG: zf-TFIIB domain-containing protein [Xanthomonadales bacterium]|nr:zf-TFIIB domain-containing protein [Xanthomonadales bacterium]